MKKFLLVLPSLLVLGGCFWAAQELDAPPLPPAPPPPPPPAAAEAQIVVPASRAGLMGVMSMEARPVAPTIDRDRFENVTENPVVAVADEPISTFSIDVDTASYAVVRNFLEDGQLPPSDAVRIEEMINYFEYDYALPDPGEPFATHVEIVPSPWNAHTQLLHIGLQGYEIIPEERPRANLVFLIDVSGSMNAPDKLPLAIQAMHMLVDELDPEDTVSIVVYAGAAGAVLEPTEVRDARQIHRALDRLSAGGSTAGGAGLALAYDLAERNFDEDAVNRVMLLTDGDFNVGVTGDERLEDFVARKRDTGIYLSVMGFGRGNYNDQMMQAIAQAGNGVAAYIDSREEARRLLVQEASSSLFPIAEDVKVQIEFNPARVSEYRLIGYETRLLDEADFNNDEVDAGEVGSGHAVTAIYEIAAPGSEGALLEPSRYQPATELPVELASEYAFLRVRHKAPGADDSQLMERPVTMEDERSSLDTASESVRFSTHVAGFAQMLRGDPYMAYDGYGYAAIAAGAETALGPDPYGFRQQFVGLVREAQRLSEEGGNKVP